MILDIVDLDKTAEVVYGIVIDHGSATIEEAAAAASLTHSETVAAARELERRRLVSRAAGDPDRFTPAPPDLALQALLLDKEEQLKRAYLLAQELSARYHEHDRTRHGAAGMVEVVSGRGAVLERVASVEAATSSRIRVIDRPPSVSITAEDNYAVKLAALTRGVSWQAIYDTTGLESGLHDLGGELGAYIAAGEQARILSGTPIGLLISDDRIGLLPQQSDVAEHESMVMVYSPALLEPLSALFDQLWLRALPLELDTGDATPRSPAEPSADERQLITLMAAGMSNGAIARQLWISKRTLDRRTQELLCRLGAQNRAQAMLRACALGWIDMNSLA